MRSSSKSTPSISDGELLLRHCPAFAVLNRPVTVATLKAGAAGPLLGVPEIRERGRVSRVSSRGGEQRGSRTSLAGTLS